MIFCFYIYLVTCLFCLSGFVVFGIEMYYWQKKTFEKKEKEKEPIILSIIYTIKLILLAFFPIYNIILGYLFWFDDKPREMYKKRAFEEYEGE